MLKKILFPFLSFIVLLLLSCNNETSISSKEIKELNEAIKYDYVSYGSINITPGKEQLSLGLEDVLQKNSVYHKDLYTYYGSVTLNNDYYAGYLSSEKYNEYILENNYNVINGRILEYVNDNGYSLNWKKFTKFNDIAFSDDDSNLVIVFKRAIIEASKDFYNNKSINKSTTIYTRICCEIKNNTLLEIERYNIVEHFINTYRNKDIFFSTTNLTFNFDYEVTSSLMKYEHFIPYANVIENDEIRIPIAYKLNDTFIYSNSEIVNDLYEKYPKEYDGLIDKYYNSNVLECKNISVHSNYLYEYYKELNK